MKKQPAFGNYLEALMYPALLLVLMWAVYAVEIVYGHRVVTFGVRPGDWSSWPGIFLMPLLHAPDDIAHIVNNSFPTFVLLAAVIYYYREVAWKVLAISWLGTGLSIWLLAKDEHAYHIGMSGVDYALFGFLFLSGFFRRIQAMQVITLFVVFVYGSMFWGIFPQKEGVSWEGHFSGMAIGMFLAYIYRKAGPKPAKYQYEIEKELGIEPPDLEGEYNARLAEYEQRQRELEAAQQQVVTIVYHVVPKRESDTEDQSKLQE